MRHENEEVMRRMLAADANLMIINLKNAIAQLEECRGQALHSKGELAPVLGDVAELYDDTAQLVRALGATLSGALEKLQ